MSNPVPVAVPHTTHKPPTLLGPHQPDLAAIIADLQRRVSRLESKLNTH